MKKATLFFAFLIQLFIISCGQKKEVISEPQYEIDSYYATSAFSPTIDQAAKKATLFMVNSLRDEKGLTPEEAYALCSLKGDSQIAKVVDLPNMLVTMHMSKSVLKIK